MSHSIVGRMLRKRDCGRIIFLTIRAQEKIIQAAGTPDTSNFEDLKRIPSGSILRLSGEWGTTNRGVETLFLRGFTVEVTPVAHLPDKFHGLGDGTRHRRRTLDLLTNESAFETARLNSSILHGLREVMYQRGYREFNTGILQSVFEGGLAKPFETVLEASKCPFYLSLTSELKLKRLIAAGFERVSEITQSFRNEGLGKFHSPEFTLLEAYGVDQGLEDMISFATELLKRSSEEAGATFNPPVSIRFVDAYRQYVDPSGEMSLSRLQELHPGKFVEGMPYFTWVMKVLETIIGPNLLQPTFVTELPAGLSPLVKRCSRDETLTERAFLFCRSLFVADLYVDENDPGILEAELVKQAQARGTSVNDEYLEVVRIGIPCTAGIGLGVNRLQMLYLPDTLPFHIRETILFPLG